MHTLHTLHTRQTLTDELERQLLQEAIAQQFRPHPLRTLRRAFNHFLDVLGDVAELMHTARARSFQTQAL